MVGKRQCSRRNFVVASGRAVFVCRLAAAGAYYDAPAIKKRVEKAFKIAGCRSRTTFNFAPDGTLWVLDQIDPNKVFRVHPEDGSIIEQIQTESIHGSGITYGNGALWLVSTKSLKTLKVNAKTGKTLKSFDTPGAGFYGKVTTPSGAYGLKWVDGKY